MVTMRRSFSFDAGKKTQMAISQYSPIPKNENWKGKVNKGKVETQSERELVKCARCDVPSTLANLLPAAM